MIKVLVIIGTRPEAIKMAPVILQLKKNSRIHVKVCLTGQHRIMADSIMDLFGIVPDIDFNIMTHNQSLSDITTKILSKVSDYLAVEHTDIILVQGDTTTAFAASLAAFYSKVKIAHIEAGLRTWDKLSPFPEEFNRTAIGKIADIHFAPTEWSKANLLQDGIKENNIFITGNTVIDALFIVTKKLKNIAVSIPGLDENIVNSNSKIILITGHRRENFGNGFDQICTAIEELALTHSSMHFVYPVHLNPNVSSVVFKRLNNIQNIHLISPLGYLEFVFLMQRSFIILTDSGGVQEEGPSLGKPVLLMRESTERPEGIDAGTVILVGVDSEKIVSEFNHLVEDSKHYEKMSSIKNPYGDGHASEFIVNVLLRLLENETIYN